MTRETQDDVKDHEILGYIEKTEDPNLRAALLLMFRINKVAVTTAASTAKLMETVTTHQKTFEQQRGGWKVATIVAATIFAVVSWVWAGHDRDMKDVKDMTLRHESRITALESQSHRKDQ